MIKIQMYFFWSYDMSLGHKSIEHKEFTHYALNHY